MKFYFIRNFPRSYYFVIILTQVRFRKSAQNNKKIPINSHRFVKSLDVSIKRSVYCFYWFTLLFKKLSIIRKKRDHISFKETTTTMM